MLMDPFGDEARLDFLLEHELARLLVVSWEEYQARELEGLKERQLRIGIHVNRVEADRPISEPLVLRFAVDVLVLVVLLVLFGAAGGEEENDGVGTFLEVRWRPALVCVVVDTLHGDKLADLLGQLFSYLLVDDGRNLSRRRPLDRALQNLLEEVLDVGYLQRPVDGVGNVALPEVDRQRRDLLVIDAELRSQISVVSDVYVANDEAFVHLFGQVRQDLVHEVVRIFYGVRAFFLAGVALRFLG